MNAPADIRGYDIEAVPTWLVTCQACGASKVVADPFADVDALTWAGTHYRECPARSGGTT